MRGGYDYEESYEDTSFEEEAPAALATPSDDQILAFVQANIDNQINPPIVQPPLPWVLA